MGAFRSCYNGVNRAKTAQEAKGHGLKAWPYISNFNGGSSQDGIIYYPSELPDYPQSGNDRFVQFSQQYVHNPFLRDLRALGYSSYYSPTGFPAQLDLDTLYGKLVNSCS